MKLYAISDLHVSRLENWDALQALPAFPDDWLIVAGDVCESIAFFALAMGHLVERFARVFWAPGNHDLWSHPREPDQLKGVFKYNQLVTICRELGVVTPEEPYLVWPGPEPLTIAPVFTLYDYSFRPDYVPAAEAVLWAAESNVMSTDEVYLHPDPFAGRAEWCWSRVRYTERRLAEVDPAAPLILVGHWPLRQDLVVLPRIPRFSLWCGTRLTEGWHTRFPVRAVIHGHLHIRDSRQRDGVPFHEVSLGYPHQWRRERGLAAYLRRLA